MTNILLPVIVAVLSGGLFTFLLGLYQARKQEPQVRAEIKRLSTESDSFAVTMLKEALDVTKDRVANLEESVRVRDKQLIEKDRQILDQNQRIQALQEQVYGMRSTLEAMNVELEALRKLTEVPPSS